VENAIPRRAVPLNVSPRIFFFVILVTAFLGPGGLRANALLQGEPEATSQESSTFDNALRQFQESWQKGTAAERKKLAETLIGEADKLPDSNPRKARGLLVASSVYVGSPQSITLIRRVVALDEKNLGADDPHLAGDYGSLAVLLPSTDVNEVESLHARAVMIAEAAKEMEPFQRVMTLNSAATFYRQQKKYKEAERVLRRAVEFADGLTPAQKSLVPQLRASLAEVLQEAGKKDEAEHLIAEPVPLTSDDTGTGSDVTRAENDALRARHYKEQGKPQEAELFYRHAISGYEKVPESGFSLAQSLNELADICHSEKRDVEAEDLYRRALEIQEKTLALTLAMNARVLSAPFAFQNFLRDQGRLNEIEPVYQRALAIQEQYLGPSDYSLSETLQMLAAVYREEGKPEAAVPLCQRALQISERYFGEDDPHVSAILNEYARNLEAVGRTREASAMRTRADRSENRKASVK
jgi:tetratricopeptide (TPR) repeat protein